MSQNATKRKRATAKKTATPAPRKKDPTFTLRPYKFTVIPIVQQIDKDGEVILEQQIEPVQLYSLARLKKFVDTFETELGSVTPPVTTEGPTPA